LNGLANLTPFIGQDIAFIDPDFDANHTKGCMSLGQSVIDIGSQSMQGNFSLDLFLGTGNFCTAETTANDYANSFGVCTHGFLHCLFHRAAERDTFL
jgi:hypothetical protein